MDVLLIRHGEAIDDGPAALGDDGRWLTGHGRARTREVAALLAQHEPMRPLAVWTSPLVRAVQTAEIVVEACGLREHVRVHEALSTRGSPREVLRLLTHYAGPAPLALVGHEPGLSILASEMLGSQLRWPGFKKSGVLAVRFGSTAPFLWALDPRTLQRIEDPAFFDKG